MHLRHCADVGNVANGGPVGRNGRQPCDLDGGDARRARHLVRTHHHGESETGIYVVAGNPEFIYSEDGHEVRLLTKPGDYVYVPPFVHHIESNANSDEEAVVVIARTTQEAIVENLDEL